MNIVNFATYIIHCMALIWMPETMKMRIMQPFKTMNICWAIISINCRFGATFISFVVQFLSRISFRGQICCPINSHFLCVSQENMTMMIMVFFSFYWQIKPMKLLYAQMTDSCAFKSIKSFQISSTTTKYR